MFIQQHIIPYEHGGKLYLHKGSEVLCAGMGPTNVSCIWVRVDPEQELEERKFHVCAALSRVEPDWKYINTFFEGEMVWHVFEEVL